MSSALVDIFGVWFPVRDKFFYMLKVTLQQFKMQRFEYLDTGIRAWGYEPYAEFRDDVHKSRAAQIAYRRIIEGSLEEDRLEDMTKDELIRRVRQLNLLAISATNRAKNLEETKTICDKFQQSELDRIRSERNALQCVEYENLDLRQKLAELQKFVDDSTDADEVLLSNSVLNNNVIVLQGLLRSKQQYIDACETEIAGLKALVKVQKNKIPTVVPFVGFES
jgi:hypothetical protein